MMVSLVRILRAAILAGCCAIALSACGRKEQAAAVKGGQVVATVGKDMITTQELENELRWNNVPPDKQKDPDTVRRVLGDLVLRKYLVQQALASNLDREPGVLLNLLRSREQVLESAYLMRKAAANAPEKADIDRYISSNPAKFADRKIFNVEQIGLPVTTDTQAFVEANKDAKSLDEIDEKLTAAGIPHGRQMGFINSGELTPDFLQKIKQRKPDDVFFVRAGASGVYFKVLGEQTRPLEGEAATNLARQMMRADAVKAEAGMAAYSASTEAKYEGEYAKIMPDAPGTPGAGAKK